MTARKSLSKKRTDREPEQPAWVRTALALTLVPVVAGIIFIATWALDIDITGNMENQIYVGMLLMLTGFIFSNLLQKRWRLFAGWTLFAIADLLFLLFVNIYVQAAALFLAIAGLFLLGFEIFRRMQQNS